MWLSFEIELKSNFPEVAKISISLFYSLLFSKYFIKKKLNSSLSCDRFNNDGNRSISHFKSKNFLIVIEFTLQPSFKSLIKVLASKD